jgi:hypothetical protein
MQKANQIVVPCLLQAWWVSNVHTGNNIEKELILELENFNDIRSLVVLNYIGMVASISNSKLSRTFYKSGSMVSLMSCGREDPVISAPVYYLMDFGISDIDVNTIVFPKFLVFVHKDLLEVKELYIRIDISKDFLACCKKIGEDFTAEIGVLLKGKEYMLSESEGELS